MIVAPGSPEDVLRCNAWPGSQVCPLVSARLGIAAMDDQRRARRVVLEPWAVKAIDALNKELDSRAVDARYSTHKSPRPEEWDDIDETHARVSKAARER